MPAFHLSPPRIITLIVLVALTAACGSTVQLPGTPDGQASLRAPGVEAELGRTISAAPTSTARPTSPEGRPGTSRPAGGNDGSAQPDVASGGTGSVAPSTAGGSTEQDLAFGVTETTISIGIKYTRNQGETASNLGGEGYAAGDERDYYDAVIEALNQGGGIAGLEIAPVYYVVDPASGQTSAQIAQATCTAWTQDNEVFAGGPAADDTLLACLNKQQVFGLSSALTGASASTFARFPYHIEVSSPGLDAVGTSLVTGLERGGYYGEGRLTRVSRVGLATWDIPAYREAVERSLLPAAEAADLSVQVEYITNPQSLGELGATQASMRSAILRFATSNIDHVLILDGRSGIAGGALLTLLFMQNAASQAYEPRYGLSSHSGLSGLYESGVPESQLEEALAAGWVPLLDTDRTGFPDSAVNSTRKRCLQIYEQRGFSFSSGVDEYTAMSDCDFLMFLKTAIEASGKPISSTGVLQTIDHSLGSRYASAVTFATSFSGSKHAGARYAHNAIWTPDCACFRYTGAPYDF